MVDLTKPITYNGRPARVLCTDRKTGGGHTLVIVSDKRTFEDILCIRPNDPLLENVKRGVSRFINVYKGSGGIGEIFTFLANAKRSRPVKASVHGVLEIVTDEDTGEFIRTVFHKE